MSLTLAGATLGAGLAAAGGSLVSGLANWFGQKSTNEENWARNEALTREQWRRDDTAVQRRVADLKAAGLSPVLAAGSAANTSQPISSSSTAPQWEGNPAMDFLSAVQQKANITSTNAGTELIKFQQGTEQWKQQLMQAQVNKTIAEGVNLNKQNDIFDLDMMSKINLRNNQASNLLKQSELLSAETIFKQTALDKLKTEIDIAKIQREASNLDLATYGQRFIGDMYSAFGRGIFDKYNPHVDRLMSINDGLKNIFGIDHSWYWDNN